MYKFLTLRYINYVVLYVNIFITEFDSRYFYGYSWKENRYSIKIDLNIINCSISEVSTYLQICIILHTLYL